MIRAEISVPHSKVFMKIRIDGAGAIGRRSTPSWRWPCNALGSLACVEY
jgi:hypothetical protein